MTVQTSAIRHLTYPLAKSCSENGKAKPNHWIVKLTFRPAISFGFYDKRKLLRLSHRERSSLEISDTPLTSIQRPTNKQLEMIQMKEEERRKSPYTTSKKKQTEQKRI